MTKALRGIINDNEIYGGAICEPRRTDGWKVYRDRAVADVQEEIRRGAEALRRSGGLSFHGEDILEDEMSMLRIVNYSLISGLSVNIMLDAGKWKDECRRLRSFIQRCNRRNLLRMTVRIGEAAVTRDVLAALRAEGCAVRCEIPAADHARSVAALKFYSQMCPAFVAVHAGGSEGKSLDEDLEYVAGQLGRRILWKEEE